VQIITSITDPELAMLLHSDHVGVIPTDTVYGLAARATSPAAVERLYALKHRERKPGTIIAANVEQLLDLGIDHDTIMKVARYWPAPLSIVLPLSDEMHYLHQGVGSAAFRVVADETLRMLLEQTGPLATSSANLPGEVPARNLREAQAYFGDHVDFYVDGGDIGDREPSTVARLGEYGLEILRPGAANITEETTQP